MPPRYAYWTILIDGQPTAFRAGDREDLLPTFNRLKEKHESAAMMWFQNGKLWPSRLDAQQAMRARGERGRLGDERQSGRGGFRGPKPSKPSHPRAPAPAGKLEWKPKGQFASDSKPHRSERPQWKPKSSFDRDRRPDWKPKGSFDRDRKPEWKPRGKPAGANVGPKSAERRPRRERLEWTPKAKAPGSNSAEKRKWIPKPEYKKAKGIEAPRDSKWRPGGEHRDPRQKYKDAKKARWSRFKQNIRQKWEKKQGRKKDDK
jgi:hypothetical protein